MMNFNIELKTGEIKVDNLILSSNDKTEDNFICSNFFQHLIKANQIKKLMPHHFFVGNVKWENKLFELTIRPQCFDNIPFMLYLVDKQGEYYSSLSNWEKRTEIAMLEREVNHLCEWLTDILILPSATENVDNGKRWIFDWGRITVSFETRSFNCGIYITYN